MIDPLVTLRTYLAAQTPLTALTGARLYAGVVYPPPEYAPGQYAICFNVRGGALGYDRRLLSESFTFKCYGQDEQSSMALYRTLVDVLDEASSGAMRYAELELSGVPLREQETAWPFVLTYFRITFDSQKG